MSEPSLSIIGEVERPVCLSLEELRSLLDGDLVADFHCETRSGFPRLVGPSDWDCFLSVKSVDRIELTREPAQATAAGIALARLEP